MSLSAGCENRLVTASSASSSRADRELTGVPQGVDVGVFDHYEDARSLVNRLVGEGVPARHVSIVGAGVTVVERILARYSYGRAALTSGGTGLWLGVFAGLLVSVLTPEDSFAPMVAGGLIGAGAGMIVGIALYTSRGATRPRYRSTQQVIAATYRVVVDQEVGGKAKRLAAEEGGQT